jgi:hypothetical protein
MARSPNATASKNFPITLSLESVRLLEELAARGIYGRSKADVAARFIERALEEYVEKPRLKLRYSKVKSDQD